MEERTISAYSPYSVSASVAAGRIMCLAMSFTLAHVLPPEKKFSTSLRMPAVGRCAANAKINTIPMNCVGSA